jgi:hypothetical protein
MLRQPVGIYDECFVLYIYIYISVCVFVCVYNYVRNLNKLTL